MSTTFRRIDPGRFGPWALVTGASSGIGREFARQLAANGLHLILVARRAPILHEVAQHLTAEYGVECDTVSVDLASPDYLAPIAEAAQRRDVGLVISNAGDMLLGELLDSSPEALLGELRVNAASHLGLTRHFGQRLVARGRGGILLVSSLAGLQPVPFIANYSAAKAYTLALGEAVHRELAPKGVHVTVLVPGATDTPMLSRFGADQTPMRRLVMSVEACVSDGLAALSANRPRRVSGSMNRATLAMVPRSARTRLFGGMNRSMVEHASRTAAEAVPSIP
jgi:uncharacterized protein